MTQTSDERWCRIEALTLMKYTQKKFIQSILLSATLVILISMSTVVHAVNFTFTKIADDNTIMPGTNYKFTGFGDYSIDGALVSFIGVNTENNFSGVYRSSGTGLTVIADRTTLVPRGEGTFSYFYSVSQDGPSIYFSAGWLGLSGYMYGVFRHNGINLEKLFDSNTPTSDWNVHIHGIWEFSVYNGKVAFPSGVCVSPCFQEGLFLYENGKIITIAKTGDLILDNKNGEFSKFRDIFLDSGDIAFLASRSGSAYYDYNVFIYSGDEISVVANFNTYVPNSTGYFNVLRFPRLNSGEVMFYGEGSNGEFGIYKYTNDALSVFVDHNTIVPQRNVKFSGFSGGFTFSKSNKVAFRGLYYINSQAKVGIYTNISSEVSKVIERGDLLNGKAVYNPSVGPSIIPGVGGQHLSDNSIVFRTNFYDNSQGIYRADGNSATLTVNVTGSGTVYSTPGGINCGSDCSESYTPGTTVMLTATPASGYVFSGWGGACVGVTTDYCNLTMDANKSAAAEFKSLSITAPLHDEDALVMTTSAYSNFSTREYFNALKINHSGTDLALSSDGTHTASEVTVGKPVYPICDGEVEFVYSKGGLYSFVKVRHHDCSGQAVFAYYGHLTPSNGTTTVTPNQSIGTVKDWNRNSHLHLTIDTNMERDLSRINYVACNYSLDANSNVISLTSCNNDRKLTNGRMLLKIGWGQIKTVKYRNENGRLYTKNLYITENAIRQLGFISFFDIYQK